MNRLAIHAFALVGLACAIDDADGSAASPRSFGSCEAGQELTEFGCSFALTSTTPTHPDGLNACYIDSIVAQAEGWHIVVAKRRATGCDCRFDAKGKRSCADFGGSNPTGSGSPMCGGFSARVGSLDPLWIDAFYDIGDPDAAAEEALAQCNALVSQRCDEVCAALDASTAAGAEATIACCTPIVDEEIGALDSSSDGGTDTSDEPVPLPAP